MCRFPRVVFSGRRGREFAALLIAWMLVAAPQRANAQTSSYNGTTGNCQPPPTGAAAFQQLGTQPPLQHLLPATRSRSISPTAAPALAR